jgi:hypothetical protein
VWGFIDLAVAEAAVDAFVARVVSVIELDRLLDRVLHSTREWAPHIQEQSTEATHGTAGDQNQRQTRGRVVSRAEERGHSGLACI